MGHLLGAALVVLFLVSLSFPQTAVVTRNVNLRPDPSTSGTPVDKSTPPTQLQHIETRATNSFLHVKVNNEEGSVWVDLENPQRGKRTNAKEYCGLL